MDLASIIIGVIVIASFVVPVWLLNINKNKYKKAVTKRFKAQATSLNLNTDELEIWRERGLGIDKQNKTLFWAEGINGKADIKQLDIATIQSCKYIATTAKDIRNKMDVLDKVYLRLVLNSPANEIKIISIYNSENEQFADDEIKRAKKWVDKITGSL